MDRKYDCFMECKRAMCDVWDKCLCASHAKCDVEWGCSEHRISTKSQQDEEELIEKLISLEREYYRQNLVEPIVWSAREYAQEIIKVFKEMRRRDG